MESTETDSLPDSCCDGSPDCGSVDTNAYYDNQDDNQAGNQADNQDDNQAILDMFAELDWTEEVTITYY